MANWKVGSKGPHLERPCDELDATIDERLEHELTDSHFTVKRVLPNVNLQCHDKLVF